MFFFLVFHMHIATVLFFRVGSVAETRHLSEPY